MKTFLFIFIFVLSLKADYFYTGKCIDSAYVMGTSYYIRYSGMTTYSTSNSTVFNSLVTTGDLFYYNPTLNTCNLKTTTDTNQILLSSLTGILIGFTILFFAIFLTIKVGSKK